MALTLATFNVLNLLDPADERERAVLPAKLDWLARTLSACDADVIGLQEVGPTELVRAVAGRMEGGGRYLEPFVGTADARGIRCAVLSRLPMTFARVHTAAALPFPVFRQGDPAPFGTRIPLRRGVVHVRVDAPGIGSVDVLVVHFKSPRPVPMRDAQGAEIAPGTASERAQGALRSIVWRAAEALHVRGLVDEAIASAPDACLAVAGDMNDLPDSPVLRTVRGEGEGELLDCAARIPAAARFSIVHGGRSTQVDHVLATGSLYARLQAARFLNAELREHPSIDVERERSGDPARLDDGREPPPIDSDHAPLVVRFG